MPTPTQADLVRAVARIHGLPTGPISAPAQPGMVNDVAVLGGGADRYVVRIPRDRGAGVEEFATEAWCAGRTREHGVPTAEVVAVGVVDSVAYSVQRFVPGATGGAVRDAGLWRTLGRYARTVGGIALEGAPGALFSRFGRDLPAAWRAHLDYNLDSLDDDDPLLGLGVYDRAGQSRVRDVFASLRCHEFEFGLSHGDIALRNVVVGPGAVPVLIDWGSAVTGPVPYTDLLVLLRDHDRLDDPRADDITSFVEGYGADPDVVAPRLAAMRILAAVDLVRWALDCRRDRLDQAVADARERVRPVVAGPV